MAVVSFASFSSPLLTREGSGTTYATCASSLHCTRSLHKWMVGQIFQHSPRISWLFIWLVHPTAVQKGRRFEASLHGQIFWQKNHVCSISTEWVPAILPSYGHVCPHDTLPKTCERSSQTQTKTAYRRTTARNGQVSHCRRCCTSQTTEVSGQSFNSAVL